MKRKNIALGEIQSIGYDALLKVLEVEFRNEGGIWQFDDVSEKTWYDWKNTGFELRHFMIHMVAKCTAKCLRG